MNHSEFLRSHLALRALWQMSAIPFVLTLLFASQPAQAQSGPDILGPEIRENAKGALAVLGISAVPNETASALFLDTGSSQDNGFDFQSGQLGGGFRVGKNTPLYLEGYIGFTRYDPVFILSSGAETSEIPAKWTGVSGTGGVGWEFELTENLKLRPIFNFTLGRVQSDSSVAAQIASEVLELELDFLSDGGITAYGYGASLLLAYNNRWQNDRELDVRVRHTRLRLQPFDSDDLVASADAVSTVVWSRYRFPSGAQALGRPLRFVGELAGSHLPGDQGTILNTDWLAMAGFGVELDLTKTDLPVPSQARFLVRAATGDDLRGFSFGISITF